MKLGPFKKFWILVASFFGAGGIMFGSSFLSELGIKAAERYATRIFEWLEQIALTVGSIIL